MSGNLIVAWFEESLLGWASATDLALKALKGSPLLNDYPPGFSEHLAETEKSKVRRQDTEGWLRECAPYCCYPPRSAEHLFFSLVLVDESFALAFRRTRPTGIGFENRCEEFTDALSHAQKAQWDQIVATTPTPTDLERERTMAIAIERRKAEFSLVAEANCYQVEKFYPDKDDLEYIQEKARGYERLYPLVLDAFENEHGAIVEEYWCEEFAAGVVRTTKGDKLHFEGNLPVLAEAITDRSKDLRQRAGEFLSSKELGYILPGLYSLLTQWLALVDATAPRQATKDVDENDLAPYEKRLDQIERQINQRMAWRGQRWYIGGTLIGLTAVSVVLGALALPASGTWQQLFEGAVFGAAGAIASVLLRMHRGGLRVNASQGPTLVYAAAMVRPLMGALFGAVICAAALSGHFAIDLPKAEAERFFLLVVLGFVAGFSERWAPNLLEVRKGDLDWAKAGDA